MPEQQSNTRTIICERCGTTNQVSKSLAKRYFEGYKPSVPMYMNESRQQGKQPNLPRCRGCGKSLI